MILSDLQRLAQTGEDKQNAILEQDRQEELQYKREQAALDNLAKTIAEDLTQLVDGLRIVRGGFKNREQFNRHVYVELPDNKREVKIGCEDHEFSLVNLRVEEDTSGDDFSMKISVQWDSSNTILLVTPEIDKPEYRDNYHHKTWFSGPQMARDAIVETLRIIAPSADKSTLPREF